MGGEGGGQDSDEAKTCSKRTKEQAQAKNRNRNNAFQSDMPAGIFPGKCLIQSGMSENGV